MKKVRCSIWTCAALAAFALFSNPAEAQCVMGNWGAWTDVSPLSGDWDQSCSSSSGWFTAHVVAEQPGWGGFRRATATRTNWCSSPLESTVRLEMQYERIDQDTGAITGSVSGGNMADCTTNFLRIHWNEAQNIWVRRARCRIGSGC